MKDIVCADSVLRSKINLIYVSDTIISNKVDLIADNLTKNTHYFQSIIDNLQISGIEKFSWWMTVCGTIISIVLTCIVIYLTVRNKEQRISVNLLTNQIAELKQQTDFLKQLILFSYRPNLKVDKVEYEMRNQKRLIIKNIGGDCQKIQLEGSLDYITDKHQIDINTDLPSGGLINITCNISNTDSHTVTFKFQDRINNEYKQDLMILPGGEYKFKNVENY